MPSPPRAEPRIPPELRTDRLLLRCWREADLAEVTRLFAQPEFWRYPFGGPLDAAAAERFVAANTAHWDRHGYGRYAVVLPGTGRLIGYVGLQLASWFPQMSDEVEIGWRLDSAEWGKGYATEGALRTLQQGFELLGAEQIIAVWEPANAASGRITDKLGMSLVAETTDPRGLAICVMRITEEEWSARSAEAAAHPGA